MKIWLRKKNGEKKKKGAAATAAAKQRGQREREGSGRWQPPRCPHPKIERSAVTFKDGTRHVQKVCGDCGLHLGYEPRGGTNLDALPQAKTRAELGLPTGCRGCGVMQCKRSGCCQQCEDKGIHKALWDFADELGSTLWRLTFDDLFEFYNRKGFSQYGGGR